MGLKILGSTVHSICPECAKENGATWPNGHCATFWEERCNVCQQGTFICDVSDWNWPKNQMPMAFSIHRRD